MGAKEKKIERKLMEMKMNAGWSTVNKANAQENPLGVLPSFNSYMKDYYFQSDWGWNEANKKAELYEDSAWFLIARKEDTGEPVAYSHFRYDMDHDDDVLYCYEIQTDKSMRRKGLGKFM